MDTISNQHCCLRMFQNDTLVNQGLLEENCLEIATTKSMDQELYYNIGACHNFVKNVLLSLISKLIKIHKHYLALIRNTWKVIIKSVTTLLHNVVNFTTSLALGSIVWKTSPTTFAPMRPFTMLKTTSKLFLMPLIIGPDMAIRTRVLGLICTLTILLTS